MIQEKSNKVLIVDDDTDFLDSVSSLLVGLGYSATSCKDAKDAIALIKIDSFDTVLTDIKMHEVSGLELLEKIKEIDSEIPVILMSGHAELNIAINAIKRGAFDFVTKPFHPEQLIQSLKKAIKYNALLKIERNYKCELEDKVKKKTEELESTVKSLQMEIAERKKSEELLEKAKKEAEMANNAKSQFLANMSHEIRTPMNGIIGMAELIQNSELTSQQRESLDMLKTSADNLMSIINDILDISKIEAGKLDFEHINFNLRNTITEILNIHKVKTQKNGFELLYNVSPDVPNIITGDPGRLRQILINLVGNAIKFTENGKVVVSVEVESQTKDAVFLHFSVSDTGIGIPEDKKKIIFDAFTQADGSLKRKYGGTGLGLSISSRLIEIMKGRIWVESKVGKGSTFNFTAKFGIATASVNKDLNKNIVNSEQKASDIQLNHKDRETVHILIAEDNIVNQKLVANILIKSGYIVEIANNGEEAVEALKKQKFDIVLMDVQMPVMDGIEATQAIRSSMDDIFNHDIPIIAVTAHAFEEDRQRFLEAGMDSCIIKPFKKKDLIREIERLVSLRVQNDFSETISHYNNDNIVQNAEALERLDGDEELLKEICYIFIDDAPKQMGILKKAIENSDALLVERQAHSIKSASANIAANSLSEKALKIELTAKEKNLNNVQDLYEGLETEIEKVLLELKDM